MYFFFNFKYCKRYSLRWTAGVGPGRKNHHLKKLRRQQLLHWTLFWLLQLRLDPKASRCGHWYQSLSFTTIIAKSANKILTICMLMNYTHSFMIIELGALLPTYDYLNLQESFIVSICFVRVIILINQTDFLNCINMKYHAAWC